MAIAARGNRRPAGREVTRFPTELPPVARASNHHNSEKPVSASAAEKVRSVFNRFGKPDSHHQKLDTLRCFHPIE